MVELSDQNIEDPNSYRKNDGGTWIYDHFPKYGKNSELPRIGFHKVTTLHDPFTIGDITSETNADIQATIVVKRGKKYDFDNDGENEAEEDLLDYLHQRVKDVIEDNQDEIDAIDNDVGYVIPTSSDTIKPEGKNIIMEAVTFEAVKYS